MHLWNLVLPILLCSLASPPLIAAPDDRRPELSRRERLQSIRVAASVEYVDDVFARQQTLDGFNAIVLDASTSYDSKTGAWTEIAESEIVRQLDVAHRHNLSVILHVPALVVIDNRGSATAISTLHRPMLAHRSDSRIRAFAAPDFTILPRPIDDLRQSLERWYRHDRGEILGVYFTGEDVFLLEVPAAWQLQWKEVSRELNPMIVVFGMIGEFSLVRSPELAAQIWEPRAFDHLIVLNYPYDLAWWWTSQLNHEQTSDPDAALLAYEEAYFAALNARYLSQLPPSVLLLFVHQAFVYPGTAPGSVPRTRDLELQVTAGLAELARRGQSANHAVAWFYTRRTDAHPYAPLGYYDVIPWVQTIRQLNQELATRDRIRENPRIPPRRSFDP